MPVCTKCFIDKPQEEYYKEVRKENGRTYYKKYCLDCFRKQSRDWKLKNRLSKKKMIEVPIQEEIIQPVVPELQPEVLEIPEGYKKCSDCNEVKPFDDFYKSNLNKLYKNCKICYVRKNRAAVLENQKQNGGSERVPYYPNDYADEYQKEQTFWLLKLLGWTYNDNGVWSKEGIKDKDKKWYIFKEGPKRPKKRTGNNTGRKFATVHKHTEELILKHKEGIDFYELGNIYGCSHTTIRKIVKKYYDEKR